MKISTLAKVAATGTALLLALTACSTSGSPAPSDPSASNSSAPAEFTALKRIELIAPAAPGSGWDQTARAVQNALQTEKLATSVEVSNVPGASGTVALGQIAPKKGQEDLLMASGLAMMSGIITNGTPVTLDDLTPIARLIGEYEAIVVPAGSPYKNIDELFATIKKDPKGVAIAGGSAGSADHLFIGLLAQHYGVNPSDINYVPYSGGGEATTALLATRSRPVSRGSASSRRRSTAASSRACSSRRTATTPEPSSCSRQRTSTPRSSSPTGGPSWRRAASTTRSRSST